MRDFLSFYRSIVLSFYRSIVLSFLGRIHKATDGHQYSEVLLK